MNTKTFKDHTFYGVNDKFESWKKKKFSLIYTEKYKHQGLYFIEVGYKTMNFIIFPIFNLQCSDNYFCDEYFFITNDIKIINKHVDNNLFEVLSKYKNCSFLVIPHMLDIGSKSPNPEIERNRFNRLYSLSEELFHIITFILMNFNQQAFPKINTLGFYGENELDIINVFSGEIEVLSEDKNLNFYQTSKKQYLHIKYLEEKKEYFRLLSRNDFTAIKIKYALRLYHQIVYLNNLTNIFVNSFTLFEWLGNPIKFELVKNIRENVISVCAKNSIQIQHYNDFIKNMTGEGEQIRTEIVHNGKLLENLKKPEEIVDIIFTIQSILVENINFLFNNYFINWNEVKEKRKLIAESMKKNKVRQSGRKFRSGRVLILDMLFIKQAVANMLAMYHKYSSRKVCFFKMIDSIMNQVSLEGLKYIIDIEVLINDDTDLENIKQSNYSQIQLDSKKYKKRYNFKFIEREDLFVDYLNKEISMYNRKLFNSKPFNKIVIIHDLEKNSCNKLTNYKENFETFLIGRLSNNTTLCPVYNFFDFEYLLYELLGIPQYEETSGQPIIPLNDLNN